MKRTVVLFLSMLVIASVTVGQSKAVSFKKLQQFLPAKELKGFERKKPTGSTQSGMGMTTSEAKVRYLQIMPENYEGEDPQQTVEVTISDMAGVPYGNMAAMAYSQDFENETEEGYEKSVTIKGYRGKESAQTGDSKACTLEFMVANRFVIKLEGSGFSDGALLKELVDNMNLSGLAKVSS